MTSNWGQIEKTINDSIWEGTRWDCFRIRFTIGDACDLQISNLFRTKIWRSCATPVTILYVVGISLARLNPDAFKDNAMHQKKHLIML